MCTTLVEKTSKAFPDEENTAATPGPIEESMDLDLGEYRLFLSGEATAGLVSLYYNLF